MEKVSESFSFGGQQLVFSHKSETNDCEMNFAVFLPPNFKNSPETGGAEVIIKWENNDLKKV